MPIKKTLINFGVFMGTTTEENRDKSLDTVHTEVVHPEKSLPIDFETFEYFIQKWQEVRDFSEESIKGYFGDALVNFSSKIEEPFYILMDIVFTKEDAENITEFIYEDRIVFLIEKEGKEYEKTIDTIEKLYELIYG